MMEPMGPIVLGFSLDAFLMIAAGVFYILCAIVVWRSYKKDRNELVGALLAFLVYQSFNMLLMGMEMHTMEMMYSNLAALSVFIGSAYMLKFPFSSFSKGVRNSVFFISLIALLALFAWFMRSEDSQMLLMQFTLWYDLVINGVLVGGFMLILALKTSERWLKVKAIGGSTGVISCCVVSNGAMIGGAFLTSALFGFLAPVLILGSLLVSRSKQ